MSSIQTTPPIHESSTESEQYTLRRSSDPDPSQSFASADEFNRVWAAQQQQQHHHHHHSTFGSDHSMDSSPAIESTNANNNGHWWNDIEKERASLEAEWTQHLASVSQGEEYPTSQLAHSPSAGGSFGTENAIRGGASGPYNSMLYVRQPPSPMLDGEDYTMMNSADVKLPSVPSPPESPGFHFSAAPSQLHTPELGFPRTPGIPQNCFTTGNYPPPQAYEVHPNHHHHHHHHHHHRRNTSISPTPPSRSPSTHDNNSSVIAVTATALAAASTTANKHHHHAKSKHGPTRPGGPSRRKSSNSSMRSSAKPHSASSSSGGADEINFVNFTPHDANRILNGVAPSGSSKTKARREREALEKRRKLSEAAAAAVLAAGGDASALAKVDLL
jgi:hypothetical protein